MPRFLTPAWVDQVNRAAATVAAPPGIELTVAHHVTGGPDGDVVYIVRLRDGTLAAGLGSAADADVHLHEDYATACAIARGELSAQQAVANGRLRLSGDTRALVAHAEAFGHAADALRRIAAETTY